MDFELTINLDNAAFDHDSFGRDARALANALHELADRLSNYTNVELGETGSVRDINGNHVGAWEVKRS